MARFKINLNYQIELVTCFLLTLVITGCLSTQLFKDTPTDGRINKIDYQVFKLQPIMPNGTVYGGGGTAFLYSNGSVDIVVTNAHVCLAGFAEAQAQGAKDGARLFLLFQGERRYVAKLIARSNVTDLCALEAPKDLTLRVQGLRPALKEFDSDEIVTVFGHPFLRPLTKAEGRFLNYLIDPISMSEGMPPMRYGRMDLLVAPGNSGSPALDAEGRVAGVVFAFELDTKNGLIVPLVELIDFVNQVETVIKQGSVSEATQ